MSISANGANALVTAPVEEGFMMAGRDFGGSSDLSECLSRTPLPIASLRLNKVVRLSTSFFTRSRRWSMLPGQASGYCVASYCRQSGEPGCLGGVPGRAWIFMRC